MSAPYPAPLPTPAGIPPPPGVPPYDWRSDFRNFLNVTSTIALVWTIIFGLLTLLALVVFVARLIYFFDAGSLIWFFYSGITAFVSLMIHAQCRTWGSWADQGQYAAVRQGVLLWAILGFLFGLVLGILLFIIHVRLEPYGGGFFWGPQPPGAPPVPNGPPGAVPPPGSPVPSGGVPPPLPPGSR